MPRSPDLGPAGRERPESPLGSRGRRLDQERRFRQVELFRDRPHLGARQPVRVRDDRERVAGQRLIGKNINDGKSLFDTHHRAAFCA